MGGRHTGEIPRIAPAGADAPADTPTTATGTIIRVRGGRRSELRRQLREVRRLRNLTLIVLMLVVAGAIPLYLGIQTASRDPVFADLDALDLPSWADVSHTDQAFGSRWCIKECRFRERTWQSSRGPEDTWAAYEKALRAAGWTTWAAAGCSTAGAGGVVGCWQRDEYVLDLWATTPLCNPIALRATAAPSASAVPAAPAAAGGVCPGAAVTAKVFNIVAYHQPKG